MAEQTLKIVLTGDGGALVDVLDESVDGFDDLGDAADKAGKQSRRAGQQLGWVEREARKLAGGTRGLVNQLGSLKTILAGIGVGAVAKQFVDAASTSEQLRVRLQALLGSVSEGSRLFDEMSAFASRVPFEFEQIMQSATTLAGVAAGGVDEVAQLMPLIGDLAAVSGLGIEQTTEQVVRMFSAGAASADLFRERGILAMLGFQAGVSVSAEETRRRVIDSWEATDSRFRGVTEQLAQTWQGRMSMMSDKWFAFRNQVMDAGLFEYIKSVAGAVDAELGGALEGNEEAARRWSNNLIEGMEQVARGAGVMADGFHGVRIGFKALELGWNGLQLLLLTGIDTLLTALVDLKTEYAGILEVAKFITPLAVPARLIDGLLDTESLKEGQAAIRAWKADVEGSVAAVKGELGELATFLPSQELEQFLARVRGRFEENQAAAEGLAGALGDVGDGATNAAGKTKPLTAEQIAARKATDDLKKSLQFELDQLKRTDRERAVANALRGLSEEQIRAEGAAIAELAGRLHDEEQALNEASRAREERRRQMEQLAEEQAEAWRRPFENAIDGIQDAGVDMFETIYSGGLGGARDFGDALKSMAIRWAAEISALLVFRPVLAGLGGGAAAAATGAIPGSTGQFGFNPLSLLNGGGGGFSFNAPFAGVGQSIFDASIWLGNQSWVPEFVASGAERLGAGLQAASFLDAGAGFLGGFAANKIFGGGAATNIGSTAGGLIAAAAGLGPLGIGLAAFGGGGLGSLFGSKPSPPKFHVRGSANPFSAITDNDGWARSVEAFGALGGIQFSAQHIGDNNSFLENQGFVDALAGVDNLIASTIDERFLSAAQRRAQAFSLSSKGGMSGEAIFGWRAQEIAEALLPGFRAGQGGSYTAPATIEGLVGGILVKDNNIERASTELAQLDAAIARFGRTVVENTIDVAGFRNSDLTQFFEDVNLIGMLGPALDGTTATANLLAEGIAAIDDSFAQLAARATQLGLPLDRLNDLREAEKRQLEQTLGLGGVRDLLNNLTATGNSPLAFMETLQNASELFRSTRTSAEAGDQLALNQLPGTASNLVNLLRQGFASGDTFFGGLASAATGVNGTTGQPVDRVGRPTNNLGVAGFDEIIDSLNRLLGIPALAQGGITNGLSFAGEAGPEAVIPLANGNVPVAFLPSPQLVAPVVQELQVSSDIAAANSNEQQRLLEEMLVELREFNSRQRVQPVAVAR